jgi:nucleoside-diphosphate-sugar epimerase
MTRPSVLVTGGAGFLGTHLCRFLSAQGFAVRSVDGDIRDPVVVAAAMRGVGYVVHAAEADRTQPDDVIYSTGVTGTWNVLQAAARNHVDRVVFLSSSAVYGVHEHHLMHEADELRGRGAYAESKIEAESLCQGARLSGMCVPILRCADIVGSSAGGLYGQLFEFAAAGRHFPMPGPGWRTCQVLDLEDVCDAVYQCLVIRAGLVNDTFNLAARDFSTVRVCFQDVLDRAGHGGRVISLPRPLLAALGMLGSWSRIDLAEDNALSVRHIDNKLNFRARHLSHAALLRHYTGYLRLREPIPRRSPELTHSGPYEGVLP